jgi:hypothetical protein
MTAVCGGVQPGICSVPATLSAITLPSENTSASDSADRVILDDQQISQHFMRIDQYLFLRQGGGRQNSVRTRLAAHGHVAARACIFPAL